MKYDGVDITLPQMIIGKCYIIYPKVGSRVSMEVYEGILMGRISDTKYEFDRVLYTQLNINATNSVRLGRKIFNINRYDFELKADRFGPCNYGEDGGKRSKRQNGLKCLNKLKKAYPKYIFGLANGRPHYRKSKKSRNVKMSKTMEKICNIKRSSNSINNRRRLRIRNMTNKRKSKSKRKKSVKRKSKSKRKKSPKKSKKKSKPRKKSSRKSKKKLKARKKSTSSSDCKKSSQKKYRSRPGPPYPAQDCKNKTKSGNDGEVYRSSPNKNGIFTWKKI